METSPSMAAHIVFILAFCLPSVCLWWAVSFALSRRPYQLQYRWRPFLFCFIVVWVVDAVVIYLLRQYFATLASPLVQSLIVPLAICALALVAYAKVTKAPKVSGGDAL